MASSFAGNQKVIIATVIAVVIIGASIVVAISLSTPNHTLSSSANSSQSTAVGGVSSSTSSCDQPPYLVRLASRVEQTQQFAQQSHGLSYSFAYGNNQSATTGTAGGKPFYAPPLTSLAFYSYGTASTTGCPSVIGTKGVVGALWIQVPINNDGSYNLANMSVYFTPGVFSNSTATSSSASTTGQAGGIVVVSAALIGPYTPAGPTVELMLRNEQGCCVTSLSAILELNSNYTFTFESVSASSPLDQGQVVSANQTLIGAGFDSNRSYTLVIKGTTQDTVFTDITQTKISSQGSISSPFSFIYLTASAICTGPGGYAPCWGSDVSEAYVFVCSTVPNLLSGPATPQTCTQRVTSTLTPYPSYTISITLPYVNQTTDESSWANCMWTVQGITPREGYAHCVAVNATSFVMGIQAPPHPVTLPPLLPKPLLGELSAQNVSCSSATGVCTLTMVNNSTTPLELEDCQVQVIVSSSDTVTESGVINGTIGGPAMAGIPANSEVTATCTAPTTQFLHQAKGSLANVVFMVKLLDSWYSYPAGTETTFNFEGTWS